jgi:Kef-type K+ transport system membrane component KefB
MVPGAAFADASAAGDTGGQSAVTLLIVQLGVILFAARVGGMLFDKIKLPSVLGELLMGVLIGPHLLGATGFPGFPEGLFPLVSDGSALPVSRELYAIAAIASVVLLFMSDLETDISMFLRYSVAGLMVGVGGVMASFLGSFSRPWV